MLTNRYRTIRAFVGWVAARRLEEELEGRRLHRIHRRGCWWVEELKEESQCGAPLPGWLPLGWPKPPEEESAAIIRETAWNPHGYAVLTGEWSIAKSVFLHMRNFCGAILKMQTKRMRFPVFSIQILNILPGPTAPSRLSSKSWKSRGSNAFDIQAAYPSTDDAWQHQRKLLQGKHILETHNIEHGLFFNE